MGTQGMLRNALLDSLTHATLQKLAPELQSVSLQVGFVFNEPGEEVEQVIFPQSGMVSLLAVMLDGSAIETATIGREGAIGAMVGLGPHITQTRTIVQTPLIASRVNALAFRNLVLAEPELRDLVVRHNEALLAQVQVNAACNAIHNLEQRLARWILQTRDRIDEEEIPLTHELLSEMLGVRRSSVSEIANKLQSANLISYTRGKIHIDDRDALERTACECYQTIKHNAVEILKRRP
ncbi:MAG: Crp/Fnr family transcriptional regulator [Alphaproteobacteria bacterium]|nr:Crp/Fnr family transcriptional regulator [Alphaproteobacteria bacterium]